MSRRDTIIVSVLLNAGLLVILFVSALKTEKPQEIATLPPPQVLKEETPVKKAPPIDQIDQAITKYSKAIAKKEEKKTPPPEKKKEVSKKPSNTIIVQKGDTLEKIARRHKMTVDALMQKNDLIDSRLSIGQVLLLPKEGEFKSTPTERFYTVKGGDSPWTIAQKHHMQVEELLRINNMDSSQAKRLRPGDKLRIE